MWTFMKENKSEWGKRGPKNLGRGKRTFGQWMEGLLRHILDNRDGAGQGCYHEFRWDYGSGLSTAALFLNVHVSRVPCCGTSAHWFYVLHCFTAAFSFCITFEFTLCCPSSCL